VTVTTDDGLVLSGRYYHNRDGAPLDIGFHGYRSHPITDFSGGTELSFQMGHNVLLVDQRAHGKSEGKTISFGILERRDILSWVDYAMERFGDNVKILLYGVSMGGATVLMASELDLPKNVKCIVADCPYSSPEEIIRLECAKTGIPPVIGMPLIKLGALIFGNLKLSGVAEEAVKNTKVPILILHGEEDKFVPCDMSRKIKAANPDMVTLITFPNAAHGYSYIRDPAKYEKASREFFEKYLSC
jgi:pimeloyl-ACP methyl ester carboxylesterase